MADNVAITAGSGTTMGADEVIDGTLGTVKVGFGKIMDGTLDSTNKLVVNSSGEATVKDTAAEASLSSIDGKITAVNTGAVVVSSSALPTGAATAAKQPALGTAGTPSADVITVQGKASMTPVLTDGSATTQPVSGTVTADTELTTADLDTGAGTDTRAVVGLVGAKSGGGVLIPGDATKGLAVDLTATGANTTALKVDGSAVTQPISGAVSQSGTWTVQPGNTANTTAWKVDASSVAVPVTDNSGSLTVDNAGTFAVQSTPVTQADTFMLGGVNVKEINGVAPLMGNGATGTGALRVSIASDSTGVVQPGNTQNTTPWLVKPSVKTISTTITRPADTNAYAAGDTFANSTTVPTAGGFTFTSAALVSGGSGTITDCIVSSSAKTNYNGELWIFDQATTAKNDNAAFDVSTSDVQNLVAIIPFQTSDTNSTTAVSYITGLNINYTCVGTANLRFLVKIMSAVTPASAEVLAVRIKVNN